VIFGLKIILNEWNKRKGPFLNVVSRMAILATIGSFGRVLYLSVDPHGFFNFVPRALDSIWWNATIVLWENAFFLLILYWIELLSNHTLTKNLHDLQRFRLPFLISIVVCSVCIIPLGLWEDLVHSFLSIACYYGVNVILVSFLIVFSSYHGLKLLKTIKNIQSGVSVRNDTFNVFISRLTHLLLGMDCLLAGFIIIAVVYTILGSEPFPFIGISLAARLLESATVTWCFLFLYNSTPTSSSSYSGSRVSAFETKVSFSESGLTDKDNSEQRI